MNDKRLTCDCACNYNNMINYNVIVMRKTIHVLTERKCKNP